MSYSPYNHGASVSIVHAGQKLEPSDTWPYLATPRVIPALKPNNPTVPAPLRNPSMIDGSYLEDAAAADSSHLVAPLAMQSSYAKRPLGATTISFPIEITSEWSKLLLFAAAACGLIVLIDIAAKKK